MWYVSSQHTCSNHFHHYSLFNMSNSPCDGRMSFPQCIITFKYKLTNCKFSLIWRLSILFNWILYKTSVVTLVIFLCTWNLKGAMIRLAGAKPRLIGANVIPIFLPLELKVISWGYNFERYVSSSGYWLVLGMLGDVRGINCEKNRLGRM